MECISQLPLSPVNCRSAVELYLIINTFVMSGEPYVIEAPKNCKCGAPVIEGHQVVHSNGVLMATFGACQMQVLEHKCSSPSCGRTVVADGREVHSLIFNVTSAETHVLLRTELQGVTMDNGTLSSRLKQYRAACVQNCMTGLVNSKIRPRSMRTLQKLCSEMLRLMTMCPDAELFRCENCDMTIDGASGRLYTSCVDGIYQGYTKRKEKPQKNIAEPCMALPLSSNPLQTRPKTSFFRQVSLDERSRL